MSVWRFYNGDATGIFAVQFFGSDHGYKMGDKTKNVRPVENTVLKLENKTHWWNGTKIRIVPRFWPGENLGPMHPKHGYSIRAEWPFSNAGPFSFMVLMIITIVVVVIVASYPLIPKDLPGEWNKSAAGRIKWREKNIKLNDNFVHRQWTSLAFREIFIFMS